MAFTNVWVETDPDGSVIPVSQLDNSDRLIKNAVRERLEGDPANPDLTGLIEVGSFTNAPKPRKGTARVYVDTDATIQGYGASKREDGRLAWASDTNKLYHVATAGVVALVTGVAAVAIALQTGRTINGVTFDGTANITVPAAAGTLTGTALAAGVVTSSLTSVGVLVSPHMTGAVVDSGGLTVTLGGITVTGNSMITGTLGGITTLTATTFSGALSGNASTATALQTARAINGVNFDGTAPITVTAAAGTLTGATLAAGVTASSLTSVGVLASPHMTGAVVDSGGFTVTSGTSAFQTITIGGAAITPTAGVLTVGVKWAITASQVTNAPFQLPGGSSSTPSNLLDGDMWIESSVLKVRLGGVTKTVTVT